MLTGKEQEMRSVERQQSQIAQRNFFAAAAVFSSLVERDKEWRKGSSPIVGLINSRCLAAIFYQLSSFSGNRRADLRPLVGWHKL